MACLLTLIEVVIGVRLGWGVVGVGVSLQVEYALKGVENRFEIKRSNLAMVAESLILERRLNLLIKELS